MVSVILELEGEACFYKIYLVRGTISGDASEFYPGRRDFFVQLMTLSGI
jgi:hypothetical protein